MSETKSNIPFSFQVLIVGGFVVIAFMLFALARSIYRDTFQVGRYIDSAKNEIAAAKLEIEEKQADLAYVETPQFREKVAKDLLSKRREGEEVIVFTSENQEFTDFLPEEQRKLVTQPEASNPEKWRRYVFGF